MPLTLPAAAEAAVHVAEGNRYLSQGDPDSALDCYVKAVVAKPDHMDAHNNLATILIAQGQFEAVANHFREVLKAKPDYAEGHTTLALALLGGGKPEHALAAICRGLACAETTDAKALFVRIVRALPASALSADLEPLLLRALTEPWGRPSDLTKPCLARVRAQLGPAASDTPVSDSTDALARSTLLQALLETVRLDDAAMEHRLTAVRRSLLAAVSTETADIPDEALPFACALARQCFINEYVYAEADEEKAAVDALEHRIISGLEPTCAALAVLAAYRPLHRHSSARQWLAASWPPCIDALLTQQVREPAEEARLRATIPALTSIQDEISLKVQDQYEENPYPRWIKTAPPGSPKPLDARLRGRFPFSAFRDLDRRGDLDVLVAGCGTGQQVIEVSQRIESARVLAVDLSRASLAYARRVAVANNVRHVEFAQADILALPALERTFDVVDCGGVLHHMADPLAGWQALRSLLRPRGLMRIALYSERARRIVVTARSRAEALGFRAVPEDIRRFRQELMGLPETEPLSVLVQSPDFYTLSECRDLLFHVHEHRFTLPQIAAFLNVADLVFLGFEAPGEVMAAYDAAFPGDRARSDLARWDHVETRHPLLFTAMYQFWVQDRR